MDFDLLNCPKTLPKPLSIYIFNKINLLYEPWTTISIDYFTLVFGPSHHAIKLRRGGGTIGLLQYNLNFEQVTEIQTKIRNIKLVMNDVEDKPIWTNFRVICPDHKKESKRSQNEFGKYNNKTHKTTIDVRKLLYGIYLMLINFL